ncbi:hypothetical protein [uncultured Flavobacterium sp.]|uniref:hypothetical protein n=1 Tax=uncultured Flavobacterium sp. TaxID=165435 RepID=UPI0025958BC9|nr:hypothetical protein [uncultured Flavobacterium sp.]
MKKTLEQQIKEAKKEWNKRLCVADYAGKGTLIERFADEYIELLEKQVRELKYQIREGHKEKARLTGILMAHSIDLDKGD